MPQEIERKFLVKGDFKSFVVKKINIEQGYLSSDPERSVRIRITDDTGFITIKGSATGNGFTRFEWEKEISLNEAKELMKLCLPGKIQKTRHIVPIATHTVEVDEFYGENDGLILAEIELASENECVELPNWLGEEVTGNLSYYNSELVKKPFNKW